MSLRSPYTGRGVSEFDQIFGQNCIEQVLRRSLAKSSVLKVLEIGCGEGRLLMELRKAFPKIELYGINRKRSAVLGNQSDFFKTASYYNIFDEGEINSIVLPKIYFCNARNLRFADGYFDVVLSQVAFPYIDYKNKALEEVWRVLKIGGKAYINMDHSAYYYPDFLRSESPRFIINSKHSTMSLYELIVLVKKKGFDVDYFTSGKTSNATINVTMTKNTNKPLKLGLSIDHKASFDLGIMNPVKDKISRIYWGYRSIFNIKDNDVN